MKKIAVVGLGYVGLISAAVLAAFGHEVIGYDIDKKKIDLLKRGLTPLHEPGLKTLLEAQAKKMTFSTEPHCFAKADAVIIAVDTPEGKNGVCDLTNFYQALDTILDNMQRNFYLIIKSTVPVGTNSAVKKYVEKSQWEVSVISNPEFLRQGQGVFDMFSPERVVIGACEDKAFNFCIELYEYYYHEDIPVLLVSPETAELSKYASNAFLAVRLSYINEIANLCETMDADVDMVAKIMGLDSRIGSKYLNAGIGFGGSCLPKDIKALDNLATQRNVNLNVVKATIITNESQPEVFANKIIDRFKGSKEGITIAVLGLSFKSTTNDVRNSPSIKVTETLLAEGFQVIGYDPYVSQTFSALINKKAKFKLGADLKSTLRQADAVAILTAANEWKELTSDDYRHMMKKDVIIFDGKNLYSLADMNDVEYHSIGRPTKHFIR